MPTFDVIINETLREALGVFFAYWWFFSFYLLWPLFLAMWVGYVQEKYLRKLKWNLLEVKVSAELEKRPKTMEEFFSGLASNYDVAIDTLYDVYLGGVVDSWFSLEIVSFEGDVHFFIRTPEMHRDMVESMIYAEYPEAEIQEVGDYIASVPDDVPSQDWDIWGTDMKLDKNSAYPIRTYKEFEDTASGDFIDPVANIVEGVNKLGPGEQIWIQILVRPTNDAWKKDAQAIVLQLAGRTTDKPKGGFLQDLIAEVADLTRRVITLNPNLASDAAEDKPKNDMPSMMLHLSSGERAVIDAIDEKMKKSGFETDIRYIYAAKREIFNKGKANSAFFSYFTQFGNDMLNRIGPDGKTKTSAYYFFPDARKAVKKKKILRKYKARTLDMHSYVLNSEELATIFHFPTIEVKGPVVPRVEAKKGKPPATLPI